MCGKHETSTMSTSNTPPTTNTSPITNTPPSKPSLRKKDWVNFAWLHCNHCKRVHVASCGELHCIPVVDASLKISNELQCSDLHCEECLQKRSSQLQICVDCANSANSANSQHKPQVEIFRAQVEEIDYLTRVWHAQLPSTILHSMIYCQTCRAVGFPGSENHLTVHGGSKGQELMHTNPANAGKLGDAGNWALVHTPQCTSNSKADGALFTIKIDREEAIKLHRLVERHALSVSDASLFSLELSRARHARRQAQLQHVWDRHLDVLISSPPLSLTSIEIIQTFGAMRRLVVVDRYLVGKNRDALIEMVREVQRRQGREYEWNAATSFGRLLREIIRSEL